MATDKPNENPKEVKKVKRSLELDEALSDYIGLAQDKRNAMVQTGEGVLFAAVQKVFRTSKIKSPDAQIKIDRNPETGAITLSWEEEAKAEDAADTESEPEFEEAAAEAERPAPANGAAKRKLPTTKS